MPKLDAVLQGILNFAPSYTVDPSPAMREREAACLELRRLLLDVLSEDPGLAPAGLEATIGGHQGSYGPVPWVRVFSRRRSPRATEGIYLAYLFAADGSRAYLSLQQGSSELRSGRMRPVNNARRLRANGAVARSTIRELAESHLGVDLTVGMDLAAARAPVKQYARQRITNYEHANIFAICYDSGGIPPEDTLVDDFGRMLTLLLVLYGDVVPSDGANTRSKPSASQAESGGAADLDRVQGLLRDAAVRRAVEVYAEDSAESYFTQLGWNVTRVGHLNLGYDLECRNGTGQSLHVEVKGTQGAGEEVLLTRNEVFHLSAEAACPGQHALYVLSEIMVMSTPGTACHGGKIRCLSPWAMDMSFLTPTVYAYRIPQLSHD